METMSKPKESLADLLLRKEKEGKVVFHTIDGLMEAELDKFIQQPTEGLLYDLNRDRVTCIHWLDGDEANYWINNFAVALVIGKLKEYYDKRRKQ
jgi:hypothetical protein